MKPGDSICIRADDWLRTQPGQHIRVYDVPTRPFFWLGESAESVSPSLLLGPDFIEVPLMRFVEQDL